MSLLSRFASILGLSRYYASPRAYWEQRHAKYGGSLVGVGSVCLSAEKNEEDYEAKWSHVERCLKGAQTTETKDDISLLDAGCGIGWLTARFATIGFNVSAVDFSSTAIDVARHNIRAPVSWHVSPLHEFSPSRCYSIVACIDVLFHIVDDGLFHETVRNLASLVEPDGRLIIQDHLVPESQVVKHQPLASLHWRWRSLERYEEALGRDWLLAEQDTYILAAEATHKDLLVFRRSSIAEGP